MLYPDLCYNEVCYKQTALYNTSEIVTPYNTSTFVMNNSRFSCNCLSFVQSPNQDSFLAHLLVAMCEIVKIYVHQSSRITM